MIDFNKAKQSFKEYLKQYDLTDGKIQLKIRHKKLLPQILCDNNLRQFVVDYIIFIISYIFQNI